MMDFNVEINLSKRFNFLFINLLFINVVNVVNVIHVYLLAVEDVLPVGNPVLTGHTSPDLPENTTNEDGH